MCIPYCSMIGVLLLLTGCGGPEPASSNAASATLESGTTPVPTWTEKKWYEGGNLHQSSIGQWKASTYENRLATSADMVANLEKFSSIESMRSAAEEMEQCISKASEGTQVEQQKVSEVAAACALLMGY